MKRHQSKKDDPFLDARDERLGFVAIGRNEGDRLKRCLTALSAVSDKIVYVDSGSIDDSVAFAKSLGVTVVELDLDHPFTAARARNAGYATLLTDDDELEYVMFIDGDCELAPDFINAATNELENDSSIGVLTGRCREARRDATIYNLLCDFEWDGPIGDIPACGGIFVTRVSVFDAVGGFNPAVIAAEDDEFCIRVRKKDWRIHRIAQDMCFHDANITRFSQWWTRSKRAGHAYGQLGVMHKGYFQAERLRAWSWGLVLPLLSIGLAPFTKGLSLILLGLYLLSFMRMQRNLSGNGYSPGDASLYARFLILSKFPNVIGLIDFWRKKLTGREIKIVEYK